MLCLDPLPGLGKSKRACPNTAAVHFEVTKNAVVRFLHIIRRISILPQLRALSLKAPVSSSLGGTIAADERIEVLCDACTIRKAAVQGELQLSVDNLKQDVDVCLKLLAKAVSLYDRNVVRKANAQRTREEMRGRVQERQVEISDLVKTARAYEDAFFEGGCPARACLVSSFVRAPLSM